MIFRRKKNKAEHLETGQGGEGLAERFLRRKGYKVLQRNFRTRFGEIDLICRDGENVVFVEVKTRSSERFGAPADAIGPDKRRRLSLAALAFLAKKKWEDRLARFDVVSVTLGPSPPGIDHLIDAFDLEIQQGA